MTDQMLPVAVAKAAVPVEGGRLKRRRRLMLTLVLTTIAGLVGLMSRVLGANGFTALDLGMLLCFAFGTPWIVVGFYNAAIGFVLRARADRSRLPDLALSAAAAAAPITSRTAIVMPAHNERPERVFRHLSALYQTLKATGEAAAFDLFVLSDTTDPAIAAAEEACFAAWRAGEDAPGRLHYRRRARNTGHKVGNLRDFLGRHGRAFDFMVVLDADSVMSGRAILRLVRAMQANPRLGILQNLTVGLPTLSPFARVFQFGVRHGLRSYASGAAWWQGDEGPYWGHNAILRVAPYMAHCLLPTLPGRPPLGGEILSHDQVEATLMRAAGYEVRVLLDEDGSFEENPPTLPAYAARDLRWCNGNMQYVKLLGAPGIRALGRLQLALAILMYLGSPLWLGFLAFGVLQAVTLPSTAGGQALAEIADLSLGIGLFIGMMALILAPMLFGVAEVLASRERRRAYGGTGAVLAGTLTHVVFSTLLAPNMAIAHTLFIGGLLAGRRIRWEAQDRDGHRVGPGEAVRGLWPQLLLGVVWTVGLAWQAPGLLPWVLPILVALLGAVPFAVFSSSPAVGRWMARVGLCAVPEERSPPPEVRLAGIDPAPPRGPADGRRLRPRAAVEGV